MYHWGSYEDLIYRMYVQPGKATPQIQIAQLTEDIERAAAGGQQVPPGVHAHLGYLYSMQGDPDAARRELEVEKALYPEAATFVDGLLARMEQGR